MSGLRHSRTVWALGANRSNARNKNWSQNVAIHWTHELLSGWTETTMATHKASSKKRAAKLNASTNAFLEALNGGPLTFGQLLNALREDDDLSLAKFAERLGVSRQHLHQIETGQKRVSPERALRSPKDSASTNSISSNSRFRTLSTTRVSARRSRSRSPEVLDRCTRTLACGSCALPVAAMITGL